MARGTGPELRRSASRSAFARATLVLLAVAWLAAAGCRLEQTDGEAEPTAPIATTPEALADALRACTHAEADSMLARLDATVAAAPGSADVLTTRGLCHWARFAADSARTDAEAAYADLTAAIDAARSGSAPPLTTPLDRIYSHRAFVALALDRDAWDATVADLTAAIRLAPDEPTHRLDRAVAHRTLGDTAAARRDLRQFLDLAPSSDAARRDMVEEMLADLGPPRSPPRARP